jgi:hypothetical protein
VTRSDLSPGQQATQSTHAALTFAVEHPLLTGGWYRNSSYLVLLGAKSEFHLNAIHQRVKDACLTHVCWHEPDFDNALTAMAVEPSPAAERLLANLPLLLREPAMT